MAGLCGFLIAQPQDGGADHALASMARAMDPRGPAGRVTRCLDGVALTALIDRDEQGGIAASEGWTVAIAGALQNARALRTELSARDVPCETEAAIVAHVIGEVGFERALGRFEGALALAAWDAEHRRLWLSRDASGVHPVYTAPFRGSIAFSTDLAALARVTSAPVARQQVQAYLVLGQLPPPQSWMPNARALAAGTLTRIDTSGTTELRWYEAGINPSGRSGNRERWAKSLGFAIDLAIRRGSEGECAALLVDDDASVLLDASLPPHVARLGTAETQTDIEELLAAWPFPEPVSDARIVSMWCAARMAWATGKTALILPLGAETMLGGTERVRPLARLRARFAADGLGHRHLAAAQGFALPAEELLPVWSEFDALNAACPEADDSAVATWFLRRLWLPERSYRAAEFATAAHAVELRLPFADAALNRIATQIPTGLLPGLVSKGGPRRRATLRDQPPGSALAAWSRSSPSLDSLAGKLAGWIDEDHVASLVRNHRERGADYTARLWALSALAAWRAVTPSAG